MNISKSIGDRFAAKLKANTGSRTDMFISDHKPIDKHSSRVLIAHRMNEKPTPQEINAFIAYHFNNKLVANLDTATYFQNEQIIDCVVKVPRKNIPFEHKANMVELIANTRYADSNTNEMWEVAQEGETKRLVSVSNGDSDELIKEKIRSYKLRANMITFEQLENSPSNYKVKAHDQVEIMYANKIQAGVIEGDNGAFLSVRLQDGSCPKVTKAAIQKVTASFDGSNMTNDQLRNFYLQFYTKEIVDGMYPAGQTLNY